MSPVAAPADRRFRRAHTKPSRRRGRWQATVRTAAKYSVLMLLGLYGAYRGSEAAMQADVLRIDRIVIQGNSRMSSGEVMAVLNGLRGEHIVWVDLEAWRRRLLASPWVRDAELRRLLPSTLEVTMSERAPIAIARLKNALYLVDEQGIVIDAYGPQYADLDLPIVDGLTVSPLHSGAATSEVAPGTDEARAELAARVIRSLQSQPELSRRVSQVDVSDRYNVALTLAGDPAVIHIGHERFLPRLQSYVELAAALRERVPDIEHVDLRFDDRIYVRPASASRKTQALAAPPSARRPVSSGGRR
jgi:cell division protein FtsQ